MISRKIKNLRDRIAKREAELGIVPVWDDRGHHYKFPDSEEYPSVTKKLQVIKDEGLMNWKMNRALEHVRFQFVNNKIVDVDLTIFEAAQVPVTEFQGAGDIGTAVHAWREQWMKHLMIGGIIEPEITDTRPEVISGCNGIINAINDLKAVPLACELSLADKKLKVGGQLDDLWAVGDEVWLIDLKTSNIGNKNSYYMQVAAYWYMFKKLYRIKVDKLFILHVSKTKFGQYELIELKHPKRYWEMAKTAFKLSDDLAELEQLKKPEVTSI